MFKNRKKLVSINLLGGKNSQVNEKIQKESCYRRGFVNKGFLKISQNSQENTCTVVCWLNSIEQFPEFQSDDVNQELRITFWKYFLPQRLGSNLCSENTKFYGDRVFQVEVF